MGQGLGKAGSTIVEFFFLQNRTTSEQIQEFLPGERGISTLLVSEEVKCKDRLLAANNEVSSIQGVSLLLTLEELSIFYQLS